MLAKDEVIDNVRELNLQQQKQKIIENEASSTRCLDGSNDSKSVAEIANTDSSAKINLTSSSSPNGNITKQDGEGNSSDIAGWSEALVKLKGICLHGVVLDGLLLWIDTKRRTHPELHWKQQILTHFTGEEITNAKNALWETAKEIEDNILGRNISRKGESKSVSEVDDICSALKTLSAKQKMPVFIGTSTMVIQSPVTVEESTQQFQHMLNLKLDNIQQSLDTSLKDHSDFHSRNHDRIISKVDVGQKKIDDIAKRLSSINEGRADSHLGTTEVLNPSERMTHEPLLSQEVAVAH